MGSFQGQLTGWMAPDLLPADNVAPTTTLDSSETITALVAEYSTTLYRVAYSVMRNAAEAEDAVQEVFLRVLKHREELPGIRDLRVWLVRITWNVVLDKKRRSKTRPENDDIADFARVLPANDRRADETLISSQEYTRILQLIDRLPRKEREALLLSAVEELSTVQIAAVLGTTESSVRSRIFRARRELSELLEKEGISR
jgi:RNA polymerase sigma-70 factor, ECF subfamily